MVVSTESPGRKLVFGKGNFQHLTEKIRGSPDITCVFLNVERTAAPTKKELEAAWGVEVFDRFTVVLHIFHCNARRKEARLRVVLAEIPLHRYRDGLWDGGCTLGWSDCDHIKQSASGTKWRMFIKSMSGCCGYLANMGGLQPEPMLYTFSKSPSASGIC
ncbi:PREDICTED: putative GTP-binding protein 6, partial [Colobus angolensis palliatus]|uniref:putative GTP-binding protein 6 n=1 Tax=Colobus angolensis palliatus TaxID=336983 RepID=UPI0005F55575